MPEPDNAAAVVRYYLNIVAEEDARAEALAALTTLVERLKATEDDAKSWEAMCRDAEAGKKAAERERDIERQGVDDWQRGARKLRVYLKDITTELETAKRQSAQWATKAGEFSVRALAAEDQAEAAEAEAKKLKTHVRALEEALDSIVHELGVPGDGYAAPVANAVGIARVALAHLDGEERDA